MLAVAPRDLSLLVAITLIWGLNLVFSKVGLREFPPLLFTALRFAIVALVLLPFLRRPPRPRTPFVISGLLIAGIPFALNFAGIRLLEGVSAAAIASQLGVPFSTLLSVALLGEVVRWRRLTGIALAFGGVVVMALGTRTHGHWAGLGLVVASSFVSSLGLIAVKRLESVRSLQLQAWSALLSAPPLLALSLLLEHPQAAALGAVSLAGWGALAYTALASSVIAHTGYYHLVQRYPVTSVAPLTTLSPVFSVLFGVLLLGDRLTPQVIAGGVCTLAGVLIITLREGRIVDTGN